MSSYLDTKKKTYIIHIFILLTLFWACSKPGDIESEEEKEKQVIQSENKLPSERQIKGDILAAVKIGEKWGFIDTKGDTVISLKYDFADNFSCGLACVGQGGVRQNNALFGAKYRFIDKNEQQFGSEFTQPSYFSEDIAITSEAIGFAMRNTRGEIIKDGFTNLLPCSEGLIGAVKDNMVGFLNKEGEWEFKVEKGVNINSFNSGRAVAQKNKLIGFLDKKGRWAISPQYRRAFGFKNGYAAVYDEIGWKFIDIEGKFISDEAFENCGDFQEGMAPVSKNGKWGFINTAGELVIPHSYDQVRKFSEGLAAVLINNKVGFIDLKGELVIPNDLISAYDFNKGYNIVANGSKVGFMNKDGQIIIDYNFDRANYFVDIDESNALIRIN